MHRKRRRMVRITHWPDCDAIEWFRKKGPPTRCPISLYLAWCDVNILKGQRAFNSRECTVSLCFFYVSNSFARSSFGLEDAHVWNWMGIDGNRQGHSNLGSKMNWSQLLLRHCEDIREGKKVSNIELIYQSVHSAWISLVGCHRPCKPVGWVGSWCLEWKIEVLRVLKSYMWTPSIAAGCDSPVAHDEARVEDCNFAFFHAFLLMCEAELGDSPLCGFCCLSGPSCWEPHGAF